ncbi:MAG: hypothetical protein IKS83_06270 [Victivallales bacterium]|nr:hypothetical protein [Victivallales bacterium]
MESENTISNPANQQAAGVKSLVRMLRILFFLFLALIVAVFVYYFIFSGIFRVDEQNAAMLLRFGVLQKRFGENGSSAVLTSGKWYWSYPYPVDEVIMVPANKSISVSTENTFKAWIAPTGAQVGGANRQLRNGVDGYLVSGDKHIFHAEWVISYRVADAAKYYLNFYDDNDTAEEIPLLSNDAQVMLQQRPKRLRGHELIIRNLLSDAVLTETANWNTEDLIRANRTRIGQNGEPYTERIEDGVRRRLNMLADRLELGIEIQTVTLVGMYQPPTAALQAFNQVNASERNKQTAIQNAEAFANSLLSQAYAASGRIVKEAEAYKETLVQTLKAEVQYFEAIQKEYHDNPRTTLAVLYNNAVQELLAKVPNKYILHYSEASQQRELRLQISQIPEERKESGGPVSMGGNEPASAQAGVPSAPAAPPAGQPQPSPQP